MTMIQLFLCLASALCRNRGEAAGKAWLTCLSAEVMTGELDDMFNAKLKEEFNLSSF